MCIVCFFLGYFVCDVIGKCGFKKPPPPPPPHEDLEDFRLSSKNLSEEEFGDYNAGTQNLTTQQFRSGQLRSESESESESKFGAYKSKLDAYV